jgi:heat shock protein HslJ
MGKKMRKSNFIAPIFLASGIFLLNACASIEKSATDPKLLNGRWNVVKIDKITANFTKAPYLIYENGRINGNNGCNNYFGEITGDLAAFAIDKIATTHMACIGGNQEQTETAFIEALRNSKSGKISGNELRFFDKDAKLILRFSRAN